MVEDTLLKLRFNRGDRDALRRIYEKYKDDLLKLAVALLNDINELACPQSYGKIIFYNLEIFSLLFCEVLGRVFWRKTAR
jgi:hypothetical protein